MTLVISACCLPKNYLFSRKPARETTSISPKEMQLTVATYNVENLDAQTYQERLVQLAEISL